MIDPIYYAMIIREKYFYRECYFRMSSIAEAALHQSMDADELNCEMLRQVQFLANLEADDDREQRWSDAIDQSMVEYDRRRRLSLEGKSTGLESGIANLDMITSGFQPGENIILCARPSMGKSAFALSMAQHMASKGHGVVIFSMEMSRMQLTNRALVGVSEINPTLFKNGTLTEIDQVMLEDGAAAIRDLPITINDSAMITMTQVHARAAALKREGKCDVIFVDYIQLVSNSKERKYQNREQEVAQVSRAAKMIAQDLNISVIMLSQLNRQCEARQDKRPMLFDLRDSGAIEQDADIVLAIHREEYYNRVPENRGKGEVIVLKNRNGELASASFSYNSSMTKIW
ncbi:MAG: replicative DNA helicase [Phocaeicola sp.]